MKSFKQRQDALRRLSTEIDELRAERTVKLHALRDENDYRKRHKLMLDVALLNERIETKIRILAHAMKDLERDWLEECAA